jgi:hypothetical protein
MNLAGFAPAVKTCSDDVDALLALDEITDEDVDAFLEGMGLSTLDCLPFTVCPAHIAHELLSDDAPEGDDLDELDRLFPPPSRPARDPWEGVTGEWMEQVWRDINDPSR